MICGWHSPQGFPKLLLDDYTLTLSFSETWRGHKREWHQTAALQKMRKVVKHYIMTFHYIKSSSSAFPEYSITQSLWPHCIPVPVAQLEHCTMVFMVWVIRLQYSITPPPKQDLVVSPLDFCLFLCYTLEGGVSEVSHTYLFTVQWLWHKIYLFFVTVYASWQINSTCVLWCDIAKTEKRSNK